MTISLKLIQHRKYCAEPIRLDFHRTDHKDGTATYFREFLRQYMMASRPEPDKYPVWNRRQYVLDSIAWVSDPLYGWCNKNYKKDGENYNVYTDGLKVYTTIDSRMQQYAEDAVYGHVAKYLQPLFTRENRRKPNAPFTDKLTPKEVQRIMQISSNALRETLGDEVAVLYTASKTADTETTQNPSGLDLTADRDQ